MFSSDNNNIEKKAKKVKVTMKIRKKDWKEVNRIRIKLELETETEKQCKIERDR